MLGVSAEAMLTRPTNAAATAARRGNQRRKLCVVVVTESMSARGAPGLTPHPLKYLYLECGLRRAQPQSSWSREAYPEGGAATRRPWVGPLRGVPGWGRYAASQPDD